jgi:hypothetical protein
VVWVGTYPITVHPAWGCTAVRLPRERTGTETVTTMRARYAAINSPAVPVRKRFA